MQQQRVSSNNHASTMIPTSQQLECKDYYIKKIDTFRLAKRQCSDIYVQIHIYLHTHICIHICVIYTYILCVYITLMLG